MSEKLKIAIGTEAFPPTIDGISTVAKCYADIINKKLGNNRYAEKSKRRGLQIPLRNLQIQEPVYFRRGLPGRLAVQKTVCRGYYRQEF